MGEMKFVSRAGAKLEHAVGVFQLNITGKVCADFGCSTGGFVDCLLQHGAEKVFAIDTGYGVLDWKLRNDPRVVVMERTNAMHASLPERMDIVTVDVSWTRQKNILPSAKKILKTDGLIVSLIKPHYEAEASRLRKGVLPSEELPDVMEMVRKDVEKTGLKWLRETTSPILGGGGNAEVLAMLKGQQK